MPNTRTSVQCNNIMVDATDECLAAIGRLDGYDPMATGYKFVDAMTCVVGYYSMPGSCRWHKLPGIIVDPAIVNMVKSNPRIAFPA